MPISNPPKKHHYAPVFYLSRWGGADGCVEQFSRPAGGEVKVRRVHPAATGYQEDLYKLPGLPEHMAQQVEQKFMSQVDDRAAKVLELLEGGAPIEWDSQLRSAWSRFIQSLQLRAPIDIAGIKQRTAEDWRALIPEIQERYQALKREGDPPTAEEYFERGDPEIVDRIGMWMATRLIDQPKLGEHLNGMKWVILQLDGSNLDLLTSDRSVERINGLESPDALITLPIGPKRLFVAANRAERIDDIKQIPPRDIVRVRNATTVRSAINFVWAADRSQARFISDNMSAEPAYSLGARLNDR